ncbi:hypothetical protein C1645_833701 [Glomus cerebriforme]|uniref:Uncharacterized protein n=1 Tax=Glomus cerebriforme TaxID=658196 RepID=A0A397SHR8_9GLOM|nr:hypothetical protein C1645_833701 [Glomus cerebriforme]
MNLLRSLSRTHLKSQIFREVDNRKQIYQSKYAGFYLLSKQLTNAANSFNKKYGCPIVLILDQIERIAKKNQDFLGILQDFAKDHADRGSIIIVFVTPQLLKSYSAWSQAIIPLEIGDISDEITVKFLEETDVNKNISKYIVSHLTGGYFALLQQFKTQYKITPNIAAEKFRKQLFMRIQNSLNEAKTIIPLDMLHKLIGANILSSQHENCTVSFHSYYVKTYFKEANKTASKI